MNWPDILTLGYIGFFGAVCAVLIIKESRLGWAMFVQSLAYAIAFGYGALVLARPDLAHEDVVRVLRWLIAIAITGGIYELVRLRVRRWRDGCA